MIVDLNVFNGPLDLLLRLIEKEEIDIYDIPINKITDAYLESIKKLDKDSEDLVDFIVMASTLIEIKSKMMLPKKDDEEDYREDLVQSLLEYKKVKSAVELLNEAKEIADLSHQRLRDEIIIENSYINIDEDAKVLAEVFFNLVKDEKVKIVEKEIIAREEYKIEDYIIKIDNILNNRKYFYISDLVVNEMEKSEIIIYFLAMLELVKTKSIKIINKNNDVYIEKRKSLDE